MRRRGTSIVFRPFVVPSLAPMKNPVVCKDGHTYGKILKVSPFGTMYHFGTITNLMPTFIFT